MEENGYSGIFSVIDLSEKSEPKNGPSHSDSIKSEKISREHLYDEDQAKDDGKNVHPSKVPLQLEQTDGTENYVALESFNSKTHELKNFLISEPENKSDLNSNGKPPTLNAEELSVKSGNLKEVFVNVKISEIISSLSSNFAGFLYSILPFLYFIWSTVSLGKNLLLNL